VDTINWCRSELQRLIPEIEALQAQHVAGDAKYEPSVFVEFYNQSEAQAAFQTLAHHQALQMAPRFIGIAPGEVIWSNLRIQWHERVVRNITTIAFICVLVIFWSIPVAVVGFISNINYVDHKISWLTWIQKIPSVILGVVTGLLPSVLLSVLMSLLPIILRLAAKHGGMPSLSRVELRTQNFYFVFQVIQVFLVTTLSSAATSAVSKIVNDPSSVTNLLATNLPKASNFYISYFILQGLSISSGLVLQIAGLILFRLLGKFLDKTPRKMYNRWSSLSGLGWGTLFPVFTNLAVISITYSCIAPLVMGFATIGLYLVYLAYRYNLLFVYNTNIDTKGLVYPRALQQTTTGCYLLLVCLIGLFAIATAIAALVLTIIFLIFVALFHISLNSALDPLLNCLPKSLEAEEEALLALENGQMNGASAGQINGAGNGQLNGASAGEAEKKEAISDSAMDGHGLPTEAPHKKPNMFAKWLHPEIYSDFSTMRRLVPQGFADIAYEPEVERGAYYNPAITSTPPLLWIPRDVGGVSRQEVHHTSKVIPITDEGAFFDEKNKITWDTETGRPPIWSEKVYY